MYAFIYCLSHEHWEMFVVCFCLFDISLLPHCGLGTGWQNLLYTCSVVLLSA